MGAPLEGETLAAPALPIKPLEEEEESFPVRVMQSIEKAKVRKSMTFDRHELEEAMMEYDMPGNMDSRYPLAETVEPLATTGHGINQQAPLLQLPIDSSDAEDTDTPVLKVTRRRTSCFFCCRSKNSATSKQATRTAKEIKEAKEAKEAAARLAATNAAARSIVGEDLLDGGAGATQTTGQMSPLADSTDVPAAQVRPKVPIDTKYAKRLDHFLDDVRGNPNRLIARVERRRANKITDPSYQMPYTVL